MNNKFVKLHGSNTYLNINNISKFNVAEKKYLGEEPYFIIEARDLTDEEGYGWQISESINDIDTARKWLDNFMNSKGII